MVDDFNATLSAPATQGLFAHCAVTTYKQPACLNFAETQAESDVARGLGLMDQLCANDHQLACVVAASTRMWSSPSSEIQAQGLSRLREICGGTSTRRNVSLIACQRLGEAYETGAGAPLDLDAALVEYRKVCTEIPGSAACRHLERLSPP